MGETIIEKIIRHNTGKAVKPGDIVTVNVDRVMIHDIFIPFVAEKFEEMGFTKLHDPDKVVLIYDHLVPASQQDDTRHFRTGDAFADKYGLTHVHRSDGICHQLMTEAGYVKPGDIAFGTDSHTTTYGCVGAFSSGIGYTEMASILGTGTMWIKVPETIKVVIDGELPENVMSKDIILRLIGDLRADGATYRALEFAGSTIENMTVASRMTMANMAIEAGAKNGIFPVDEKTEEYLKEHTKKEYASKGLAGTALGLGIGGLAVSLLNNGCNPLGIFGRNCGTNAGEVAIVANEQYLERKQCADFVELVNGMWQKAYDAQKARQDDRNILNAELFNIYSAMRNGFDAISAKHNEDAFNLYKYSRDSKDELSSEIGELRTEVAILKATRPYQDALIQP